MRRAYCTGNETHITFSSIQGRKCWGGGGVGGGDTPQRLKAAFWSGKLRAILGSASGKVTHIYFLVKQNKTKLNGKICVR